MKDKLNIEENEIDLKEFFRIIWKSRKFIVVFVSIITILTIIYSFSLSPIYEVKSVVKIGHLNENLIEDSKVLEKKLKLIFDVENKNHISKEKAIVSNITTVKKVNNFLEIYTQSYSKEQAVLKNKEVVSFLVNEYKYKIDEYILKLNLKIKKLEKRKIFIEKVNKIEIQEQIKFLEDVALKLLENKLNFNKEKLKEYQNNINDVSKRRSLSDTQNMLFAMQILNNQNLILNLQNTIENLNKEYLKLQNEKIPNLKRKLEFDIKNQISDLEDQIELEKLKLTNNSAKNSEVVGSIQLNNNLIKTKKELMVIVSFLTAFILSIFIVLFIYFIETLKRKTN